MKYLIIGGSGFLGCGISNALSLENEVFVVGKPNEKLNSNINLINIELKNVEYLKQIIENEKFNIVIHLANDLLPMATLENYLNSVKNIINPTLEIIDFCHSIGIEKFVFFSSGGTIYGANDIKEESARLEPLNLYGYSKLVIEEFLQMKSRQGLNVLIIRPSNPYGPGQNLYGTQGFIAIALGRVLNDIEINVFSNLDDAKDYIYIDDFTIISLKLINKSLGIYNLCNGEIKSIREIIESIEKCSGKKAKLKFSPKVDNYSTSFELDQEKLLLEIGEHSFVNLEKGISKFYEYIMNEKGVL